MKRDETPELADIDYNHRLTTTPGSSTTVAWTADITYHAAIPMSS